MYGAGVSADPRKQTKAKLPTARPLAYSGSNGSAHNLPPNVHGRKRGLLVVTFGKLSNSESRAPGIWWKSARAYASVDVQLRWWGQKPGDAIVLRWEQGKLSAQQRAEYEVRTDCELFREYLKNCEPLQVRLISSRTNTLIGTAAVQIPGKIVSFRQATEIAQASGEIRSSTGFALGDICFELRLKLDSIPEVAREKGRKMLAVERPPEGPPAEVRPLKVVGQTVPLHAATERVVGGKRFQSLDTQARKKILDYLLGKPLVSDGEESSMLSEICSISPAESMVEALNQYDLAPKPRKLEYLKAVDSVRVWVQNLKLTKAGQKEIQRKTKHDPMTDVAGFLIKMKVAHQAGAKLKFVSSSIIEGGEVTFDTQLTAQFTMPRRQEDLSFEFAVHLIVGSFHKKRMFYLGSAIIKLEEVLNSRLSCHKRCPVKLVSDDILLGSMTARLELGNRGLHFGPELLDAVLLDKENVTLESSSSCSDLDELPQSSHVRNPLYPRYVPSLPYRCCPVSCSQDDQHIEASGNQSPSELPKQQSQSSRDTARGNPGHNDSSKEQQPKFMDTEESPDREQPTLLHGILYLGQLKEAPEIESGGYFLVCHSFWTDEETSLTSEICQQNNFNYLKAFPIVPNGTFLERVRNNHMLVELWQKSAGEGEKLVGVTRLPLHQFYIAFRDSQLREHLSRVKLPVISIDGWSGIGSPLSSDPSGQIQATLAVGTECQIEYFKFSRNLLHTSGDAPQLAANRIQVPSNCTSSDASPKRIYSRSEHKAIQTMNSGSKQQQQTSEVANMLSAFIENLAQRLPISSERSTAPSYDHVPVVDSSPHSQANKPQLRKTADLLDNLQKALAQKPPADANPLTLAGPQEESPADQTPPAAAGAHAELANATSENKLFRVAVEIEQALNLPKLSISKKYAKRHKNRNVPDTLELEPSAYATFEGYELKPGTINTVKSHEGIVYTTHVIERNCAPHWQKRFEVQLPVDLMMNDEKRFILKVWRKAALNDAPKCRLLPTPMEDAVIGFSAIDLSVFLSGMPCILGWYNIMDFSGRCNGQIKVNIRPLENVQAFRSLDEQTNFQIPLSIDVDCGSIGLEAGNTSLSRALKRKFTELEEITQRLRARLFDVTGDENTDPDEQFERDLNTEADEGDDCWPDPLGDMSNQKRNSQYPNGALTLTTNTSSYSMSTERRISERSITGCSNRPPNDLENDMLQLNDLLKSHDIDTLINPAILKSLINPSVVSTSSEATGAITTINETEQDKSGATSVDAEMCDELNSSESPLTGDKVQLISTALQRTTISDGDLKGSSRPSDCCSAASAAEPKRREAPEGEPMKESDK